jgi:hypothetical protein
MSLKAIDSSILNDNSNLFLRLNSNDKGFNKRVIGETEK